MRSLLWLFAFSGAVLAACAVSPSPGPAQTVVPSPLPDLSAAQIAPATDVPEPAAVTYPPLTAEAIEACPVTLPNHKSPAGDENASDFNLGNESGTIFTIPWPGGKVIFSPNGPGAKEPDGSLGMKWPWYRAIAGDVVLTARRLDAEAPPPRTVLLRGNEDGYGETGFHPSGLWFSGEGCWEVTAAIGDETLTFVTLVVRIDFDPPHFGFWPPDVPRHTDMDLSGWPNAIREINVSPAGGQIIVETIKNSDNVGNRFPSAIVHRVLVNDAPAVCVRGTPGEGGRWRPNVDELRLQWQSGDETVHLIASGLQYQCDDLLEIANSQL